MGYLQDKFALEKIERAKEDYKITKDILTSKKAFSKLDLIKSFTR